MKNPLPVILLLLFTLVYAPPVSADPEEVAFEPGVSMRVYDIGQRMQSLPRLVEGQTANINRLIPTIDLSDERGDRDRGGEFGIDDRFLVEIDGFLVAPRDGRYRFDLTSDDGSVLKIDGKIIVANDGTHAARTRSGATNLKEGMHNLRVLMFDDTANASLKLEWIPPGAEEMAVVPRSSLRTQADQVRVTSPGRKNIESGGGVLPGGYGRPLDAIHPSFKLVDIRPEGFQPRVGGLDFLPDGRLVVTTWDKTGGVYLLDSVLGEEVDRSGVDVKLFAQGLAEPLGVKVVDGQIYVLQKQELTRLVDEDGDGEADLYESVASGWPVSANFHEFAFGLVYKEGAFYITLAVAINPGGATTNPQVEGRGVCVRIDPRTGEYETIAAGFRTPNGIGLGPEGDIYVLDNQGSWNPASSLNRVREGEFYGHHQTPDHPLAERQPVPPVVWLPQGEIGNSPSQPVPMLADGPYRGQMLHGEVTHGGIKRTFIETVGGVAQGAVFRFSQGLEGGVNRLAWGPDGGLYVGMIGSGGNWGQSGKKKYGLQKLMPTGEVPFEMLAVRAQSDGFDIEFTHPLGEGQGQQPSEYAVTQWRYEPTRRYGGPKLDQQPLPVERVILHRDRTHARLTIPGLKEGHVVYLRIDQNIEAESGSRLWTNEAWYTLNRLPGED